MYHEITVMSRQEAKQYCRLPDIPRTIMVSIHGLEGTAPEFADNPNLIDVCFLEFDDVEDGENAMSLEQAYDVVSFVEPWLDESVDIVVHCAAGISRSAGVAAALMLLINGNNSPIFEDSYYSPNMHCYNNVLVAAGYLPTDEELGDKYKQQFELWRAYARKNGLT